MKFTCLKQNLEKGISTVVKAVPMKHSFPILTNILIQTDNGRVKLSGTDLETVITTYVGASVEEDGAITVPARILSEFISHLSADTVNVYINDSIFYIEADKTKSKFNGVDASDFPDLPIINEDLPYIELDPKVFNKAISQVSFAVALDDTRPVFAGIFLSFSDGVLTVVGSDGFRLSEKSIEVDGKVEDFVAIINAKTIREISRLFNSYDEKIKMFINKDDNLCVFECEDTMVAARLIEGSYPDYKRIIPSDTMFSTEFLASDLLEAVKLTHVFAKDSNNTLKMLIDPKGHIKLSSSAQETGENSTEISSVIDGELDIPFEIIFNAKYLLEFLTNNKFEKLSFFAKSNSTPCVLRSSEDDLFLHVMAPMHLND